MAVVERRGRAARRRRARAPTRPAARRRARGAAALSLRLLPRPALALAARSCCSRRRGRRRVLAGGGDDERPSPATVADRVGARRRARRCSSCDDATKLAGAPACPPPPRGRVYQVWLKRAGPGPGADDGAVHAARDGSADVAIPGLARRRRAGARHRRARGRLARRRRAPRSSSPPTGLSGRAKRRLLASGAAHGDLLPPPRPRDRRLVLELRPADLPGLHDADAGRACAARSARAQRTQVAHDALDARRADA